MDAIAGGCVSSVVIGEGMRVLCGLYIVAEPCSSATLEICCYRAPWRWWFQTCVVMEVMVD
jgi:hypothetical protein